ncbi:MAG: hypothetical protein ACKVIH_05840 [Burkholderiales bacterium]
MKKRSQFQHGLGIGLLCMGMASAQSLPATSSTGAAEPVSAGVSDRVERARITAEREWVETRFTSEEAVCYNKFATHDCLNQARAQRRQALADLRRQEITLNDAQRKRRGVEQMKKLESR